MTSGRRSTAAQPATGAQAPGARPAAAGRLRRLSPRAELTAVLLLGAVGAGLVFVAMRQGWAQVRTAVPAPLPASVVTDSGQSLLPYADALVIAALASLAAVLATRSAARRVTGVLLAGLGVAIVAAATAGVSTAAALAAAAQSVGPATGAGAGAAPQSATDGSSAGGSVPNVAGFHSHAVLTAAGWQAMAVAGGVAIIAAGLLVTWRAARLPVMSSRYDSPAPRPAAARPAAARPAGPSAQVADSVGLPANPAGLSADSDDAAASDEGEGHDPDDDGPDSASMWESLSRGEDPTSAARHPA